MEHAARLLGRPHTLEGYVVGGAGRGRDLGSPTANLDVPAHVAVPAHGVYVTLTDLGRGRVEQGVTSVGTNPTFETDGVTRVETYLLRLFRRPLFHQDPGRLPGPSARAGRLL